MSGVTRSKEEPKAPIVKAERNRMVKGFGDVGFRLAVGEIGVSPWDESASPFGRHIINRLK
jgi:hypothetical protein